MATNNIKLFDQNKANMLSNEAYEINSQRLNGVQQGIASSQLQNKTLYQVSLVAYAIGQMMQANGLDANDEDAVSTFANNLSQTVMQKVLDKATNDETLTFADMQKYITPATWNVAFNSKQATTAEINAASNVTKFVNPAQLKAGAEKYGGNVNVNTTGFSGITSFQVVQKAWVCHWIFSGAEYSFIDYYSDLIYLSAGTTLYVYRKSTLEQLAAYTVESDFKASQCVVAKNYTSWYKDATHEYVLTKINGVPSGLSIVSVPSITVNFRLDAIGTGNFLVYEDKKYAGDNLFVVRGNYNRDEYTNTFHFMMFNAATKTFSDVYSVSVPFADTSDYGGKTFNVFYGPDGSFYLIARNAYQTYSSQQQSIIKVAADGSSGMMKAIMNDSNPAFINAIYPAASVIHCIFGRYRYSAAVVKINFSNLNSSFDNASPGFPSNIILRAGAKAFLTGGRFYFAVGSTVLVVNQTDYTFINTEPANFVSNVPNLLLENTYDKWFTYFSVREIWQASTYNNFFIQWNNEHKQILAYTLFLGGPWIGSPV